MRKIAIWRTGADAYRSVFSHPMRLAQLAWPQFALFACFALVSYLGDRPERLGDSRWAFLLCEAILLLGFSVGFCRALLLGEVSWTAGLRFDKRNLRLLGNAILVGLALYGIMLVTTALAFLPIGLAWSKYSSHQEFLIAAFLAFGTLMFIIMWAVGSRLAMALPAIALDEAGKALRTAWVRTRGNALRLFTGSFLVTAPLGVLLLVARAHFHGDPPANRPTDTGDWLMQLVTSGSAVDRYMWPLIFGLQIALLIAFYAHAYRQLAGGNEAASVRGSATPVSVAPSVVSRPRQSTVVRTRE